MGQSDDGDEGPFDDHSCLQYRRYSKKQESNYMVLLGPGCMFWCLEALSWGGQYHRLWVLPQELVLCLTVIGIGQKQALMIKSELLRRKRERGPGCLSPIKRDYLWFKSYFRVMGGLSKFCFIKERRDSSSEAGLILYHFPSDKG